MNQIPTIQPIGSVPAVNYAAIPQQPNYNAVKIDIHNPSVGVPNMCQPQAQYQPQYAPVTAPIYNVPQMPIYQPQQPVMQPQPMMQPQAPVYYPQQPLPQPMPVYQPQVVQPQPYPQQPVIVEQQNNNGPIVQPQPTTAPAVPAPQVSQPEVVAPETPAPTVDLNAFISRLTNPDFEAQSAAMEDIANMVKEKPQQATELVDQKVFDALNNIIAFDSSKLEGPSQAQIDARQKIMTGKAVSDDETKLANTMAPREQAERNKSYALFTIAIMDKLYADEVKKLANTTVPLTELPEATNVVNQLKDNPNPMVRASAIEALSYIQTPEYKKDLTTIFTVAKNDQDADVANAANAALEKLNQV